MRRMLVIFIVFLVLLLVSCSGKEKVTSPGGEDKDVAGKEPVESFRIAISSGNEQPVLELMTPSFAEYLPIKKTGIAINNPQALWFLKGVEPQAFISHRGSWDKASQLVQEMMISGKGTVIARGHWFQVWPYAIKLLADRPVLRLYYGRTGNHEQEWVTEVKTGFPVGDGQHSQNKGKDLVIKLNAIYLAPARDKSEISFLITTVVGLPDERSLNPSTFDTQGYSRTGEVIIIKLDHTAELEELEQILLEISQSVPAGAPESRQALEQAARAEAGGRWSEALEYYFQAFNTGGFAVQYNPEVWFKTAQARFMSKMYMHDVLPGLLQASYLAEQQGKQELLQQITNLMEEVLADQPAELSRFARQRLVEIKPYDGSVWWNLAEVFLPAVDIAEKVAPGDRRAATLYFRRAVELGIEQAGDQIKRGLELDPENPYGLYLDGVHAAVTSGNYQFGAKRMKEVLARLPGQPDAFRQLLLYEAAGQKLSPSPKAVAFWDFSQPGEKYAFGGAGVRWSPDGRRLALSLIVYEPVYRQDLIIVDRQSGKVTRLEDGSADFFFWSPDGNWLYYSDYIKMELRKVQWDGSGQSLLATGARSAALSPDGRWIAYTGEGLWLVDTGGGQPRKISDGKGDHRPFWYPDGQQLLYARDSGKIAGDGAPNFQILTRINLDNPAAKGVVYEELSHYVSFNWVVPEQVLGIVTGWDDLFHRWMLKSTGEIIEVGEDYLGDGWLFAWLPELGAAVVRNNWFEKNSLLKVIDLNGNLLWEKNLAGFPGYPGLGYVTYLQPSPSGSQLAHVYDGPSGGSLWVLSMEDKSYRLIAPAINTGIFSWSPGEDEIAVFDRSNLSIYPVN